ncbi:unannotated protein [freshwater metagenome]|uniref:Unannotated protein n=1 Tax=freshwater metagenome TaxID=449393 RepID=A0A6J6E7S5_9ZZZZ
MIAHCCQAIQVAFWQTLKAHLQLQVRNHCGEIGVTGSFAQTIQSALHMAHASKNCSHGVCYRTTRVIMTMDTQCRVISDKGLHTANNVCHFMWQRSSVGIAQHQMCGALHHCSFNNFHGEFRIVFVAIKKVLKVNQNTTTVEIQKIN